MEIYVILKLLELMKTQEIIFLIGREDGLTFTITDVKEFLAQDEPIPKMFNEFGLKLLDNKYIMFEKTDNGKIEYKFTFILNGKEVIYPEGSFCLFKNDDHGSDVDGMGVLKFIVEAFENGWFDEGWFD